MRADDVHPSPSEVRCADHRDDEPYCLGRVETIEGGKGYTCTRCGTYWDKDTLEEHWSLWQAEFIRAVLRFRDTGDRSQLDYFVKESGI